MCNLSYTETGQEYCLIEEKLFNEEIGTYYSYGIKVLTTNETISDVSVDIDKARQIVSILNKCKVSPLHAQEVIINLLD